MKFMNNHYGYCQIFHAPDGGGDAGGAGSAKDSGAEEGDPDDDPDGDEGDDPEEKKFSQAELDEAVKKRLARAKRKWEKERQKIGTGSGNNSGDGGDDAGKAGGNQETEAEAKARKEEEAKASVLEVKVACYEAGVAKDAVEDVSALARAYMAADEDMDLEDAIAKVVKKYPQFKAKSGDPYDDEGESKKGAWGQRQGGTGSKKLSGVEAKFYDLNPDLK